MAHINLNLYHAAHFAALLEIASGSDGAPSNITRGEKTWLLNRFPALKDCQLEVQGQKLGNFSCWLPNTIERKSFQSYYDQVLPLITSLSPQQLTELLHRFRALKMDDPQKSKQWNLQFQWWKRTEQSMLHGYSPPRENAWCKDEKGKSCLEVSENMFLNIQIDSLVLKITTPPSAPAKL